jgi:hypothetical protein
VAELRIYREEIDAPEPFHGLMVTLRGNSPRETAAAAH